MCDCEMILSPIRMTSGRLALQRKREQKKISGNEREREKKVGKENSSYERSQLQCNRDSIDVMNRRFVNSS